MQTEVGLVLLGKCLRLMIVAIIALMAFPVVASATWPGTNGKIFFACRPTTYPVGKLDICSMNPDGSALVNLTNTPDETENVPEVSRDGTKVVFTRANSHAWVMNADGSDVHEVTSVPTDSPTFTPTGDVAFRAQTGPGTYALQVVPAAGGAAATLWTDGVSGTTFGPRFNADGVFTYGQWDQIPATTSYTQQIYTVTGGVKTPLTFPAAGLNSNQQFSWAPDGSRIVFWRSGDTATDIWSVSAAGGAPSQVTFTANSVGEEAFPSLSPDGTKMVWEQRDATNDFFHRQIVVANADGSSPTIVPIPGYLQGVSPVWAPASLPVASFNATAPSKLKRAKKLALVLNCTGDTRCEAAYSETLTVPRKGKKAKSFKIKAKTVTLEAHSSRTVSIALPSGAKSALKSAIKAGKKPLLKLLVVAKQPGGPEIRRQTLTVKIVK